MNAEHVIALLDDYLNARYAARKVAGYGFCERDKRLVQERREARDALIEALSDIETE